MTTSTGSLSSPNYPGHYARARLCHWVIRVAPTQRVTLTFNDLDIYGQRYSGHRFCRADYVEVGLLPVDNY